MMGRRRPEQSGSSVQLRGTYSMAFHTQHESLLRLVSIHRNLYCFSCHFGNKLSKLHISPPTMANLPLAHFIHIYILLNVTNILNSFCCALKNTVFIHFATLSLRDPIRCLLG